MDTETNENQQRGKVAADMATKPIPMRIPSDLWQRLGLYVDHMNLEHPGLDMTRTDAVRMALTKFLDDFEGGRPKRPRRR